MLRKFFITLLLCAFCSCGFQVIYSEDDNATNAASSSNELASIRIKKDRDHLSQELKNNLYDILNPDYIKAEPKYFLSLTVKKSVAATFITATGASGRNRVILDITYELKNLETATIISKGKTSVNDNYDVTTNRYGTYVAEDLVCNNLTRIAAQNIRNSLVNDFIEVRKKCDGQVKVEEDFICPLDGKQPEKNLSNKAFKQNQSVF